MKPVSDCKIALGYLNLRHGYFGAVALLKGTFGVSLAVCCQCELYAPGKLQDVLRFPAGFQNFC